MWFIYIDRLGIKHTHQDRWHDWKHAIYFSPSGHGGIFSFLLSEFQKGKRQERFQQDSIQVQVQVVCEAVYQAPITTQVSVRSDQWKGQL